MMHVVYVCGVWGYVVYGVWGCVVHGLRCRVLHMCVLYTCVNMYFSLSCKSQPVRVVESNRVKSDPMVIFDLIRYYSQSDLI